MKKSISNRCQAVAAVAIELRSIRLVQIPNVALRWYKLLVEKYVTAVNPSSCGYGWARSTVQIKKYITYRVSGPEAPPVNAVSSAAAFSVPPPARLRKTLSLPGSLDSRASLNATVQPVKFAPSTRRRPWMT